MIEASSRSAEAPREGILRYVTALMLALLLLVPFLAAGTARLMALNAIVSGVFGLSVYAVSRNPTNLFIAAALGVPWFVSSWVILFFSLNWVPLVCLSTGLLVLFYSFTAYVVFKFVLGAPRVTSEVLHGAVCTYLLIGGTFSAIYSLLETLQPGSFAVDAARNPDGKVDTFELIYFSFVTQTTLGFGDITPLTPRARSIAVVQAIFGVMFLAIIISRLVGLHIRDDRD